MKHKVYFFTSVTRIVLFFSLALHIHATPLSEEQSLSAQTRTILSAKRKVISLSASNEADKENQQNMSGHHKKKKLSTPKNNASKSPSKFSPLLKLEKEIRSLTIKIEKAYSKASRIDLDQSYKAFKKLNYPEEVWHTLGQQIKAEQWPPQESWKEIIGGHLFFPASQLHKWQESPYTEHLLQCSHIMYRCMFAASFGHSLGLFYTTNTLWMINRLDDDLTTDRELNKPNSYTRMMQKACFELEQCLDRPDVCYALGQGSLLSPSLSYDYIKIRSMELFEKGSDFKNKLAALSSKLARQGYLPAYIEAAEHAKKTRHREVEKSILIEATQQGYPLAWIELASWYDDHKQEKESLKCLKKAAQAKVSYAFIKLGFKLVGNHFHRLDMEKLQKASPFELEKACNYFKKAGELHDPEGYEYLVDLKLALSSFSQDKEKALSLKTEALEAAKQGCALGWKMTYSKLARLLPEDEYLTALKVYGPTPHELPAAVEAFLNREIGSRLPRKES